MHAGVDLHRTAPTPPPSPAQRPAQTYRLEFKYQCVKTCGAPDPKVSPSTQPSTSNPGRPQGRGHSDEKGFPGSYRNLHRLSSGSWSPAGRRGESGSLHSPAALAQYENPEEAAARSTERLLLPAHFPLHGPLLFPSPALPPFHVALVFLCSLLGTVLPGPGHTPRPPGGCSMNRQSLDFILSQPQVGQAVVVLVRRPTMSLYAIPGEHCLTVQNRKGFVRLTLRHG
ncbi:2-acylglycerol O-acyltransferase 3 isoform X2 [Balaenoptera acutorostrata]|nr:2-acylglycerol O-acyltransferase 3 isoform X2 [Balaenoptera acutorostrata]